MIEWVEASKVKPGLYIDNRETPHMWLINGQWEEDGLDQDVPFAIVFGGDPSEWHHFRTYSQKDFINLHNPDFCITDIKFKRLM